MSRQILCLDFDGVLHSYTSGWKGAAVIPDPPVEGAIKFLLDALEFFDVVIFSSRSHQEGGIEAMREWLKKHSGAAWYPCSGCVGIEEVRFVKEKPPAFVGIDDRVLTFTGEWPEMETLKAFQPWNKRKKDANLNP